MISQNLIGNLITMHLSGYVGQQINRVKPVNEFILKLAYIKTCFFIACVRYFCMFMSATRNFQGRGGLLEQRHFEKYFIHNLRIKDLTGKTLSPRYSKAF